MKKTRQIGLHLTDAEVRKAMALTGIDRPATAVTILLRKILTRA